MDTTLNGHISADPSATDNLSNGDVTKEVAILATRYSAEPLIAGIKEQAKTATAKCDEIEKTRLLVEKSRGEIDARLASVTTAVAELQQQLDSVKPLLAEITDLHTSAKAAANQAISDVEARIGEITAAQGKVDSLVTAVQGHADTAATKNAEIEEGRLFAEESRAKIEGKLSAATTTVTALQEQLESTKSLLAEVTSLHTNAQTTANQVVDVSSKAAAALQSIETALRSATENASGIDVIKAGIDQSQAAIATKSQYIEEGRVHAEKSRGDIDRLFAEAQRSATNAETQHQASRGTAENLNTLLVSAQATKAAMDSNASVVERLRQQCEEYAATAKKLADKADSTQERIITYEARLEDLQSRSDERLKAIEGLLPGATSVGLAFAFNQRRAHFIVPQRFWQTVFVGSLAGLMCLAWWEFGWHSVP